MIEFDGEAEWITHELAGHEHHEQVVLWDEALGMDWPAELRCDDCESVRYLTRGEAVSKIAQHNLRKRDDTWFSRANGSSRKEDAIGDLFGG